MPKLPPIPAPSTPLLQADGAVHPDWYRYLKALDAYVRAIPT